jgi:uncharacterized membrane protein YfcA
MAGSRYRLGFCPDKGNLMQKAIAVLFLLVSPLTVAGGTVGADVSGRLPEPETLALVVGAFVAVGIVRWIRRK